MKTKEKDQEKKKGRRKNPYGEGSIYQINDGKLKGKWKGQLIIGTNPETNKPIRRSFYGNGWNEVRDKMKLAKAELDKGVDLQKQANITFGEWITTWMDNYKKLELELSTWENYNRSIKNLIMPNLGTIPLKSLKTDDIQKFYNLLINDKKAAATVRRNHQIIRSCLEKAKNTHLLSWNPCEGVTLPKLNEKEAKALTVNEMNKFIETLNSPKIGPKWRSAFLLALGTGLRQGEILALKWENINLRNYSVTIKEAISRTNAEGLIFKAPKTKKSKRTLPIPKEAAIALRLWRIVQRKEKLVAGAEYQDQGLVFTTIKGTIIYPRNFTRRFYSIRTQAGISKEINLHALRHTYATRLLENGENLKTVQELMGHADISTTGNTYAHVMPEIKRQAVYNLDGLLKRKKPLKA
ncbi:tyrosine-type recombinase/integrase [Desulfosporosinus sp. BG]|uniref:tyrosine-type recombinase/integrase n=1 Tax=Desulfosporosinus sp. BG TaxID=1633135 RepID=UPI00083B3E59|nr:tyrosine-type recombinase/integrase [Desulfosporosinus sp. BG]ODA40378.1 Phage integrase [Desulfosporosinus sp. BG]